MNRGHAAPEPKKRKFSIRLTETAVGIAVSLMRRHGLRSRADAIEYALRKVGREEGIEGDGGIQAQD